MLRATISRPEPLLLMRWVRTRTTEIRKSCPPATFPPGTKMRPRRGWITFFELRDSSPPRSFWNRRRVSGPDDRRGAKFFGEPCRRGYNRADGVIGLGTELLSACDPPFGSISISARCRRAAMGVRSVSRLIAAGISAACLLLSAKLLVADTVTLTGGG